jgi:hypothetical protein
MVATGKPMEETMPVKILSDENERGIALDPNGIFPIEGSKCLRTIDAAGLCKNAKPNPNYRRIGDNPGDTVHITYGEIKHPKKGHQQRCLRLISFIDNGCVDIGEKHLFAYPEAATQWSLAKIFRENFAGKLGCDPEEIAKAVVEHAPWQ